MNKERCFADNGKRCFCLNVKNCDGCNFYKPASKVDFAKMQKEIVAYKKTHEGGI